MNKSRGNRGGQLVSFTKDQQVKRKNRGMYIARVVWRRDYMEGMSKLDMFNWIRLVTYWVKTGAMTINSLIRYAYDYREEVDLSTTEFTSELDEKIRRDFCDKLGKFIKDRRDRMGDKDPQRIFDRLKSHNKNKEEYLRRQVAIQALMSGKCPICLEDVKGKYPLVQEINPILDCHGYGGYWLVKHTVEGTKFTKIAELPKEVECV